MKKISLVIILPIIALLLFSFISQETPEKSKPSEKNVVETLEPLQKPQSTAATAITVIAGNLEIPWDIAFLPEGDMLVTERAGRLLWIDKTGLQRKIIFEQKKQRGEGGLLGVLLHPDFATNRFLYLYMTAAGEGGQTENRVVRYRYGTDEITEDRVIISGIPGATYHDGGRMEFGPDGMIYITTGDATTGKIAQDIKSLGGKILRLKDDGTIPSDNPYGNATYSYGHRNPQGLAWDEAGRLWETEHGPTGESGSCCRDEINLIQVGANYGWPTIKGLESKTLMQTPKFNSGTKEAWAPASALYFQGSLFFGGLKGEAIYEAVLDGENVTELKTHFKGKFGRIRSVRLGPDGMFYLTTSNRDGRGSPATDDDKIIRVNPKLL
ncbi:MAG: PQQ-dependent sugar dehydrogenase [bacterium]|nr:PQQ-dependent sugar dehydrogenase [bacterium]